MNNKIPEGKPVNFEILQDTQRYLLLRDVGPWDKFKTITNAPEFVVSQVANRLRGRRLFYYDSENQITEIKVLNNKFSGFANL